MSALDDALAARKRTQAVKGLRGLARGVPPGTPAVSAGVPAAERAAADERCDMCGVGIPADHRHLLHITERRIICSCEPCWAMRSGEEDLRPTGMRTLWLEDFELPDDLWAELQIPIGLAFLMRSSVTDCVVAMYPSPAGATESELRFESWARICARNPVLNGLEDDIEGLIINRLSEPAAYVIAPIDRCYELTGTIKAHWQGISGGPAVEVAVAAFFTRLRGEAAAA